MPEQKDQQHDQLVGKELLNELVDLGGKHAHRLLLTDRVKQLMNIFHLVGSDGTHQIVAGFWATDFEKQLLLLQVKKVSHAMNAVAVMMVNEAWIAQETAPLSSWHAARQGTYVPPSQRPDRREVVIACAIDNDGNNVTKTWQILRDKPGGRIIDLVAAHDSTDEKMGFKPFILEGILPPKRS